MALVIADRVKETTTTTSTGVYTLNGAKLGFQSFAAVGNGNTTYYVCTDGVDFEVGIGTFTASGTTLSRDTILESSNSDNPVDWSAGSRDVFVTVPAEKYLVRDASGNVSLTGTVTADGLTVDGDATLQNILNIGGTDPQIRTDTSDGSDNKTLWMGGGGIAYSWDRGGFFFAQGNEAGGHVGITAGNVSGGSVKFTTGGSERMRITSAGNVGIGTSSPSSLLDVDKSQNSETNIELTNTNTGSAAQVRTKYTTDGGLFTVGKTSNAHAYGGDAYVHNVDNTNIRFATSDTERMRIDSSGNVGIGVTPSERLDVQTTAGRFQVKALGGSSVELESDSAVKLKAAVNDVILDGASSIIFDIADDEKMRIDSSGNVGIGTSSPAELLHIKGSGNALMRLQSGGATSRTQIQGYDNSGNVNYVLGASDNTNTEFWNYKNGYMRFATNSSERMRIDASGNVGIGTSSPDNNSGYTALTMSNTSGSGGGQVYVKSSAATGVFGADNAGTGAKVILQTNTSHPIAFGTDGTERMRLDSSGNLLVGKTSSAVGTAGHELLDYGRAVHTVNASTVQVINRLSNDGDMTIFQKDGTTVGSIQSRASLVSTFILDPRSNGAGISAGGPVLYPTNESGSLTNGNMDFGAASYRWKDLYLSGTIEIENGTGNVGVGKQALNSNTASENTAVGYQAGYSITTAGDNTFVGYQAGYLRTGTGNTIMGQYAGRDGTTGTDNTFVGRSSGYTVTSGSNNTILGRYNGNQGGLDIRTSSNNIVLSDGDGNPRIVAGASGNVQCFMNATGDPTIRAKNTNTGYASTGVMSDITRTSSGGNYYHFSGYDRQGGAYKFQVHDDGDVVNANNSYGAISDEKLKENIVDSGSQWDDIKALTVRKYSMKSDNLDAPNKLGVIAQEVEAAGMAGLVRETVDRDGEGNLLGTATKQVNYSILYMKAVKALQEAMDRIETLEAKVTALENA